MKTMRVLMIGLAIVLAMPALAVQPGEQLSDATQEARARRLSAELRCLVCQNQSIDDSDASLARDLRLLVRERIKAGDSDDAVLSYLVSRYGDFVLLKPRFSAQTVLLWGMPLVALIFGGLAARSLFRRREERAEDKVAGLSTEEDAELKALLERKPNA